MARTRLYTIIFVVLFVLATAQAALEMFTDVLEATYWIGFGVIIVLSFAKAYFVAIYYQHLRWEPQSLTYLYLIGLGAAVALAAAASYSIL